MTTYIVHLYREMKLSYTGIEADTPEAAAAIAGGKPTADADNIEDCDGQNLAALVDSAGDEDYSQSVTIDFEAEQIRKAAPKLLTALIFALEYLKANDDGEQDVSSRIAAIETAIAGARTAGIPSAPVPARQPYSVLLLYPNYTNDSGSETFYALVEAIDPLEAVALAQLNAAAAQAGIEIEPDDFMPLLVMHGHHASQPLFNK